MRVFFALWPNDDVRATLTDWGRGAQAVAGGRAVAAENIHLTLFFVGSVERDGLAALEDAADAVRAQPFTLVLDRIGYWRHNRIVWAGSSAHAPAAAALEGSLHEALAHAGVNGEERPYVPHVTLLRKAERKPPAIAVTACAWQVREFALVESQPVAGGVRYLVRRAWPLCL